MSKYKIALLFLGIVFCFSFLSACNNVQKESVYIEDSANSVGSIVSFSIKEIVRDNNRIMTVTAGGSEVEIKTTEYMGKLVKQIEAGKCTITGRIVSTQPASIELLSVII